MRYITCIFVFGFVFFNCQSQTITAQEQTLIIKMTIDSALTTDPGLNTSDYQVDFSKVNYFNKQAINNFLKLRVNFTEINSDSLLKNDSTWIQYGFLQKMVLKFKKINFKGNSIIIDLDKIKATDGSIGIQIIFKKIDSNYKVVSLKMIWIS